jgi:hypothetical protein
MQPRRFSRRKKGIPKNRDAHTISRANFSFTPTAAFLSSLLPFPSSEEEPVSSAGEVAEALAWLLPAEACALVAVRSAEASRVSEPVGCGSARDDSTAVDWPPAERVRDDSAVAVADGSWAPVVAGDWAASPADLSPESYSVDYLESLVPADSAAWLADPSRQEQLGEPVEKRQARRAVPVARHSSESPAECLDGQRLGSPVSPEAPA